MENNILTEKNKIIFIIKWTIRKHLSFSIAYWILLFLSFPLVEIFMIIINNATNPFKKYYNEITEVVEMIPSTGFVCIAVLFSIIITIMAFAYMHNKRSVDFFGSLPVSRKALFFARYFAVLVLCIAPIIVIGLIGALLTFNWSAMVIVFRIMGILILSIVGNVSFIAFISLCCGTAGDVIVSYSVINVIYPICIYICNIFPRSIIPGVSLDTLSDAVYIMLCPIAAPFVGNFTEQRIFFTIWWVLFSAILIAGCYILCKKRKAEIAQNAFAFAAVEIVIKFVSCFTAGFGLGWIMAYIGSTYHSVKAQYIWFVAGFIIGDMITNILLHLVFHRGLSKYRKSLPECGAVFVTGMVFLIIVTSGVFGVDGRIPDVNDVEEVCVKTGSMNTFVVKGKDVLEKYSGDSQVIEDVVDMHLNIINNVKKSKHKGFYPIVSEPWESTSYDSSNTYIDSEIKIIYKLKNGRTMTRYYEYTYGKINLPKSIQNMAKDNLLIINSIPVKYLENMSLYLYDKKTDESEIEYTLESSSEGFDTDKITRIFNAFNQDVKEKGIYDSSDGELEQKGYEMSLFYYTYTGGVDCNVSCTLLIPETYTNTIKVLNETGYANFAFHAMNSDYPYYQKMEKTDYTLTGKTIYFKVPDNWDRNLEIRCMPCDEEYMEFLTGFQQEVSKCEQISDEVYKYIIPELKDEETDFDASKVMFYQYSNEIFNCTGCIPMKDVQDGSLLQVENAKMDLDAIYEYEPMCDYKWVEYHP